MADYSIQVLSEDQLNFQNGAILDGITQGDGSHLLNEIITFSSMNFETLNISDAGSETNFADNDAGQTLNGDQSIGTESFTDGAIVEAEFQFVVEDIDTGIQYTILAVNIRNGSPSYATNEAIAFVDNVPPATASLRVISASEGPTNGGGGAIDVSQIVPICFAAGTLIETLGGAVPVENLSRSDDVMLHDGNTANPMRILYTKFTKSDLKTHENLYPVRITTGALGRGLPRRDLLVSRQHRMLVSSRIAMRMFGETSVLVPAIRLTKLPGIFIDTEVDEVEYFHVLFDQHHVIIAEGAPSESLFLGPQALKSIGPEARDELLKIFPELGEIGGPPCSAFPIPNGRQAARLIARHSQNGRDLLQSASGPAA